MTLSMSSSIRELEGSKEWTGHGRCIHYFVKKMFWFRRNHHHHHHCVVIKEEEVISWCDHHHHQNSPGEEEEEGKRKHLFRSRKRKEPKEVSKWMKQMAGETRWRRRRRKKRTSWETRWNNHQKRLKDIEKRKGDERKNEKTGERKCREGEENSLIMIRNRQEVLAWKLHLFSPVACFVSPIKEFPSSLLLLFFLVFFLFFFLHHTQHAQRCLQFTYI